MTSRDLRSYIKTLKKKAREILKALPDVNVMSDEYRSLIVNFNNTYATIQEFTNIVETMSDDNTEDSE